MTLDMAGFLPKAAPIPPPFASQQVRTDMIIQNHKLYDMSDPGTGKTRVCLDAIAELRTKGVVRSALVLAPKSILESAWIDDCKKFTPHLTCSAAFATNRLAAFKKKADIYITNHDATTWLGKNRSQFADCNALIIDEATAYKNRSSQRSRALAKLMDQFEVVVLLCATPMPLGVEDLHHQVKLLDGGERLGVSFYGFRNATYAPIQSSGFIKWVEKEGARDVVMDAIADISVRYTLEECTDMPDRIFSTVYYDLSPTLRTQYDAMVKEAVLAVEGGEVTAVHAAVLVNKLLQIASGAVYESKDKYHVLDTGRYELVADLVAERKACLLPYAWRHQKEQLIEALAKVGIENVATIDSTTKSVKKIVDDFQAGKYRVLLAHPKSASHGLTLTEAATTIWSSPTREADRFIQFNGRSYRNGQTKKTEVIMVAARGTADIKAYTDLDTKNIKQGDALAFLKAVTGI